MQAPELTAPERRLELLLRVLTVAFLAQALIYPVLGFFGPAEFPFVANSFAKDGIFFVLCFLAAGDVRQNGWAAWLVVFGHVLIVVALLGMLALGNHDSVAGTFGQPFGTDLSPTLQLLIWAAAATFLVAIPLAVFLHKAGTGRYALKYLWPHQHTTAMAMAEVLVIGPDEKLTPEQVAAGIDDYLNSFTAHEKWKSKLALSALTVYPLIRLRPPVRADDAGAPPRRSSSAASSTTWSSGACPGGSGRRCSRCWSPPSSSRSSATTPIRAPLPQLATSRFRSASALRRP